MQLLTGGPWWFLPLCVLTGLTVTALLYLRDLRKRKNIFPAILRFLLITGLTLLLLGPVIVHTVYEEQKPKILMVMDNTESIRAAADFDYYASDFLEKWNKAEDFLGKDYDFEFLEAGGTTRPADSIAYNHKKTNLSLIFDHINATYARQHIGAVILASDGIYNRGSNPLYRKLNRHIPLYTVGMGDTAVKKDLLILEAVHNSITYLNNSFPVELNIGATSCQGEQSVLQIKKGEKILYTENISPDRPDYFKTLTVVLEATEPGNMHLTASLRPVNGESSVINNKKDLYIDVIDGREKILLAYAGPHPDVSAIKSALASSVSYECIALPINKINLKETGNFSLAILHGIPQRGRQSEPLIRELKQNKIPVWCIVSTQTAMDQLALLSPQGRIDRHGGRFNESQALLHEGFTSFTIEPATKEMLTAFPPLKSPFGIYTPGGDVLLKQRIGSVETQHPLWTFSDVNGEKTCFVFGEGLWKWRMTDYARNGNHLAADELINKTVQYLARKEDRRRFRVYPSKPGFEEDENVRFHAEIYNASYEPVNTADVKLSIRDEANKNFEYVFSRSGKAYVLDLGLLPPGIYFYQATAEGIAEKISGKFKVVPIQAELVNTRADFALLRQMAGLSGGRFYHARELDTLFSDIRSDNQISVNIRAHKKSDDLIGFKWLFFVLFILAGLEWFWRKYMGSL